MDWIPTRIFLLIKPINKMLKSDTTTLNPTQLHLPKKLLLFLLHSLSLQFHPNPVFPKLRFLCHFSTSSLSSDLPHLPISTVVSLLTHQRSKSRWTHLHSLCPSGFTPTQFSQIALGLKNNPHLALRFFSFTQRKSLCKHDLNSYATIIHILSRGCLTAQARDVIRLAIRLPRHEQPNPVLKLFAVLVKTYKECGSASFVFDLLIKCYLEVKKIESCIEIVRMLMSRGLSLNVSTCNALIWVVCKYEGVNSGYEIYREVFGLDSEEVDKNVKDLKRVVRGFDGVFFREGLLEKVEDIWTEMARLGCEPNCYSYSVLMSVFCDEGRMGEAKKSWGETRDRNIQHDVMAYNSIIGGLCKSGEVGKAEDFFREMEFSGVKSSCITFEHLGLMRRKIRIGIQSRCRRGRGRGKERRRKRRRWR